MQFEINSDGADSGIETKNRESEIIAREEFQRIQYLLNSIPEEQAEVIRLRTIDDMSFVEIAELLKLPVTTIKSRFLYGISKLRSKVNPLEERTYELH